VGVSIPLSPEYPPLKSLLSPDQNPSPQEMCVSTFHGNLFIGRVKVLCLRDRTSSVRTGFFAEAVLISPRRLYGLVALAMLLVLMLLKLFLSLFFPRLFSRDLIYNWLRSDPALGWFELVLDTIVPFWLVLTGKCFSLSQTRAESSCLSRQSQTPIPPSRTPQ